MRSAMSDLRSEVGDLRGEVEGVRGEVGELRRDVDAGFAAVWAKFDRVEADLQDIRNRLAS